MVGLNITVSPDKRELIISGPDGQELPGKLVLEATEIDDLIRGLVGVRAGMDPPIPDTLEPTGRYYPAANPRWVLRQEAFDHVALGLQHRGLGWVLNLFSKAQAQKLAESLSAITR